VQKKEYDMLTWFILSGGALSAILIIYGYHKGMAEFGDVARVSLASLKNDSGSGSADNGLSFTMLLPVSICLGMLLKKGKPLMKIFFFAVLLILFFGVILTGSRGNLAGCLVILLYFFIFTRKKLRFGIFAAATLIIMLLMTPQFYIDRINNSVESHADGRTDIWYVGWKALDKYWLFGAGLDAFPKAYNEFINYSPSFMGLGRAPHNVLVGSFVDFGIIGMSLIIISLIKHYAALRRRNRNCNIDHVVLKGAFWGIMVASLSMDSIWTKTFWLLWMLIIMQKYISETENKNLRYLAQGMEHREMQGPGMLKAGQ